MRSTGNQLVTNYIPIVIIFAIIDNAVYIYYKFIPDSEEVFSPVTS
jgi:hypothetical protein